MGPALSKGRLSAVKPSRQALAAPGASQRRAYSGIVRELVGARTRGGKLKPLPGADRPGLGGAFPWMEPHYPLFVAIGRPLTGGIAGILSLRKLPPIGANALAQWGELDERR